MFEDKFISVIQKLKNKAIKWWKYEVFNFLGLGRNLGWKVLDYVSEVILSCTSF